MNYPPWLPKPDPSKKGMLLALARCIFKMHYTNEPHSEEEQMKTFNNMSSGDLERATRVLKSAGFIRYLDDVGVRSVFICEPSNFDEIASSSRADEIDFAMIKDAVMRLANSSIRSSLEIEQIAEGMTTDT